MKPRVKDWDSPQPSRPCRPPSQRVSSRPTLLPVWYAVVGLLLTPGASDAAPDAVGIEGRWSSLNDGILTDDQTQLEWLRDDNGDDIDWMDAKTYCEQRHAGWRLPSLQELKTIYDGQGRLQCAQSTCKLSSKFHVTGTWFWTSTQIGKDSTDGIELAWGILMTNGAATQAVREASYGSRVLCVRGPNRTHS